MAKWTGDDEQELKRLERDYEGKRDIKMAKQEEIEVELSNIGINNTTTEARATILAQQIMEHGEAIKQIIEGA